MSPRNGGRGTATDDSTWDAQEVISWCLDQDDPAAAFRAVSGIERTVGEPDEAQHWALPHHRRPGEPANAAAIRNARARFEQTEDLKDRAAARRHVFETHRLPSEADNPDDLLARQRERRRSLARASRWYDLRNQDGDVAELRIYDEISWWGISAEEFVRDLEQITAPEIRVAINSPGGDVFDAIAVYNALRAHPARVTTRVDSLAASAASIVVQAGDHRVMLTASQMMIHDAWGVVIGNAAEMREMADLLDMESDIIAGIYAARTGGDAEHFRALMRATTWLTAEQAVEAGLADEVVDPKPQDSLARRTLNDELAEAMGVVSGVIESAERVAALRADEGKRLSQVNRESLDELERRMEQVRALLDTPSTEDDIEREFARFVLLGADL